MQSSDMNQNIMPEDEGILADEETGCEDESACNDEAGCEDGSRCNEELDWAFSEQYLL